MVPRRLMEIVKGGRDRGGQGPPAGIGWCGHLDIEAGNLSWISRIGLDKRRAAFGIAAPAQNVLGTRRQTDRHDQRRGHPQPIHNG